MPIPFSQLYLTSYRHPDTQPFGNIMLLPQEEAFRMAKALADAHPETTAFYRFADFHNYYPRRKTSEAALREQFIRRGGKPELPHPYSFVLMESAYLADWFGGGPAVRIPLEALPRDQVCFTLGDSMSTFAKSGIHQLLTVEDLAAMTADWEGSLDAFMAHVDATWYYIEAQVWSLSALRAASPCLL